METILLLISYYLAIAMLLSLLSGFFSNPSVAYLGVMWPVILVVVITILVIVLLYYFLGMFYLFGRMVGGLLK